MLRFEARGGIEPRTLRFAGVRLTINNTGHELAPKG